MYKTVAVYQIPENVNCISEFLDILLGFLEEDQRLSTDVSGC